MRYQLTEFSDIVIRLPDNCTVSMGHRFWDEYQAWLALGNTPEPVPLPYELHSPEHYRAIRSAAWEWMSCFIRERRYDSIETCVGYVSSSVPRYRDEAQAMVAWRDAVNLALEGLVANPPAGIETWDQVKPLLPQPSSFNWPTAVLLPLEEIPRVNL